MSLDFHLPGRRPGLQKIMGGMEPEVDMGFPQNVKSFGRNYVERKNFAGFLRST
jgi:hypothetical protein